jgi:hypothetical protein
VYSKAEGGAFPIYAESDDLAAIYALNTASGVAVFALSEDDSGIDGRSRTANGIRGSSEATSGSGGVLGVAFGDGVTAGQGASGVIGRSSNGDGVTGEGSSAGFDFYASGSGTNYGPFTGAHEGLLLKNLSPESGDILCSTGVFEKSSLSQTISYLEAASTKNGKAAYGVFVSKSAIGLKLPAALSNQGPSAKLAHIKENYDRSIINALGEGQINVCSESGDFEVGDFICTSNTAGKGMRYDGLDMRYVVAKCMEPVVWTDEPSNIKMVACIYMCG